MITINQDQFKDLAGPGGVLALLAGVSAYLYHRSFGIIYKTLPDNLRGQQEQSQVQLDFILNLEVSYLAMNIVWPLILSVLFYIFLVLPRRSKPDSLSAHIYDNFDLKIIFTLFVLGAYALHQGVAIGKIAAAFDFRGATREDLKGDFQALLAYMPVYGASVLASLYLILRALFVTRWRLPKRAAQHPS